MSSQSLLITFSYPPQIRVQDTLLEDHDWTEIEGVPVFASVPPWNPMHDLLVDRGTKTLAGIVYPVAAGEHAAIAAICGFLPKDVVRYCISPVSAAALLRRLETELSDGINIAGDLNVSVKKFPEVLRSYRQFLRSCLRGELDRDQLPSDLLSVAGSYLRKTHRPRIWKTGQPAVLTWIV